MKRTARKTRRARRETSELDQYTPLARLALIAGDSLALSDEQLTDAMNALSGFNAPDELADVLHARLLELVELLSGLPAFANVQVTAERAQLEQRRGAGFVQRVAAMGTPAAAALSSHKIQWGQLLARLFAASNNGGWSGTVGAWLLRCTGGSSRHLSSGQNFAHANCRKRANRRPSSFGSISSPSTRKRSSSQASLNSRCAGQTALSSGRLTRRFRPSRCFASCTAGTAESLLGVGS
jgi:hypothetical protein